ncbi:hypothetical protein, partial [Burkholderia vietnamiensis]|uniref:hypothetical protein n=1 Tax=Burkholderia vietnamiensis TaxID=60552 RepID=UPI002652C7BE
CQASCGGSPWFPVREVGPGNPILSDSTGEPPPSTFNYAWDIANSSVQYGQESPKNKVSPKGNRAKKSIYIKHINNCSCF